MLKKSSGQSMGRRINSKAKTKKTRRKMEVPKLKGGVWLLVTVTLIISSVFLGMYFSSASTISTVKVSGNYFTTDDEILDISQIIPGMHADSLDYLEVLERVESLPYVHTAFVEVSPRGAAQIRVIEREPLVLLFDNNGRWYVDAQGVRLPRIPGKVVDVPIYYDLGFDTNYEQLQSRAFREIRDFLMVARENSLVHGTISEMAWTPDEGVVVLSDENTVRLVFGHEEFNQAVSKWSNFYRTVVPERGMASFRRIDFRFNGQIVTVEV